jgi:hypothetical protein
VEAERAKARLGGRLERSPDAPTSPGGTSAQALVEILATNEALASRVRAFARQQALATHLGRYPHDQPELAAVVRRRVSGTDHPAALHEQLTVTVAQRYEQRHPDWAVSGEADHAVDQVLELVEMLV